MPLPDYQAWAVFAEVAERRSFTAAAAALGLSKATVSKAIARLEERVGQTLFHRTSRRLALTQAARPLAEHAARIVAAAAAAEEAAHHDTGALAGPIRIAAPMSFGVAHVAPLVAAFLRDHPLVRIDLRLSDAQVDIVAGGYDLALRIADLPDSTLRSRRIADIESHLVAAPAYLATHGDPRSPADLAAHRLLGYSNAPGPWRLVAADGRTAAVEATGPLSADSGEALVPALIDGLGIARLPGFIVGLYLAAGTVVAVMPGWSPPPIGLHLVTPPGRLRPARVEALIAFLSERIADPCARADRR